MTDSVPANRHNRYQQVLRIVQRVTEALLTVQDEDLLLQTVCSIAVEETDIRLAWIGKADGSQGLPPLPAAVAGNAGTYVQELLADRLGNGDCPTALAMLNNAPCLVNDVAAAPSSASWRRLACEYGLGSILVLPLHLDYHGMQIASSDSESPRLWGTISLYSQKPHAFGANLIRIISHLARNLSLGIATLQMRHEHSKAAAELKDSESRYRTLVEMSPDAILVHRNGEILFANQVADSLFQTQPGGLLGQTLYDLTDPKFHPMVSHRLALPVPRPGHATPTVNLTARRQDGTCFPAEAIASSISFRGEPARLVVVRDISEQQIMNEKLIQAAKLSTLGEMTAGLIHELSQPLNVIRMTAEGTLLFMERGKRDHDWQVQQFTQIAEQSARTAEIIDDIRIFTRRDSSPEQIFDAVQPIRSAQAVMDGQFRHHGIGLHVEIPDQILPVKGRKTQLEQVILNLLSNAHHALKDLDGPTSDGESPTIRVVAAKDQDFVRIRVGDNGPGLSPAVRDKIFQAFVTTKQAGRGTGLGLSVSHSIISSMGGTLKVAEQGSGAAFDICLPLAEETCLHPQPQPLHAVITDAPASHIMVVEDNQHAARAMAGFLRGLGHRVTLCSNGCDALARFQVDPADIVITDWCMPSGGGEDLFARLRDYDPWQAIIIVTGQLDDVERLHAQWADDRCAIFKKPISLNMLGDVMVKFLQPPDE